ncbi:MAG: O-antigen ligase family protein [Muribaculaceae bacterium]
MKWLKRLTYIFTVLVIGFTPLDAIEISEGSNITYGRYLFIAMTFFALLSKDILPKKLPDFVKYLLVFTIWAWISIFWSIGPELTLTRCLYLIQYLIIVLVMCNVLTTTRRVNVAMAAWAIGACYIAYMTATDYAVNAISTNELYRVSEYGNPNENSFMLVYGLVMCYIIDTTATKLPSLAMTAFSVYAIIANGSRMGILLFIIAVAGFCISLWQSKKRLYVIVLIPIIIAFGSYILANIPTATLLRIMGITDDIEAGQFAHREVIWDCAFRALSNHESYYIFGSGWGTFPLVVKDFFANKGAHNFYLDALVTVGCIGLIIILLYFVKLFSIIRKTKGASIINYLLLFLPLISMMSTNWQSRRWWFMMGAFIFLVYKTNNPNNGTAIDSIRQ